MALVGEDRDYFVKCYKCKQLFDLVHQFKGFGESVGEYFDSYKDIFICLPCLGNLSDPVCSRRHLLELRDIIDNNSPLAFRELLNMASNLKVLITAYSAAQELPTIGNNHFNMSALNIDENAMHLLRAYGDSRFATHTAIDITGDGDCLFNSVATALWMDEKFSNELRLRMSLEIITKRKLYDYTDPAYAVNKQGFSFEFENYNKFLLEALTVSTDMSPAHVVALGNCLQICLTLSHPRKGDGNFNVTPQIAELNSRISLLTPNIEQLDFFCSKWSVHMTTITPIGHDDTYEDVNSILPNHYCLLVEKSFLHDPTPSERVQSFVHALPLDKAFGASQNLHVLHRRGTELVDDSGIKPYSQALIGKYYLCKYGRGLRGVIPIPDGFSEVGEYYSYRCTKKRIYYSHYGKFKEVKVDQRTGVSSGYTFSNGIMVPLAESSKLCFLYQNQRSFGPLTRTACWLTDSNWYANGTLLIMYSTKHLRIVKNPDSFLPDTAKSSFRSSTPLLSYSQAQSICSDTSATETESGQTVVSASLTDCDDMQNASDTSQLDLTSTDVESEILTQSTPSPTVSECDVVRSSGSTSGSVNSQCSTDTVPCTAVSDIENGKLLTSLHAYDLLTRVSVEPLETVPLGPKINKRYVVNRAYSRNHSTGKNCYVDDTYAGSLGRTTTVHYSMPSRTLLGLDTDSMVTNLTPRLIEKVTGDDNKITIHRRKSALHGSSRCVTWATDDTDWESDVLWEYLDGETVELNSPAKIRTHPNSHAHKIEILKHLPPTMVYRDCIVHGDFSFKNSKQAANAKASAKKRDLEASGGCSSVVYGDQVLAMFTAQAKGLLPISQATTVGRESTMFILSESYCYSDLGRFCMHHSALKEPPRLTKKDNHVRRLSVMGVDKTFNLTSAHVTTVVYHNLSLVHKAGNNKGKQPYFLGPVLIHENSNEDIFRHFFEQIDTNLTKIGYKEHVGPLIVICDGETAIRNALRKVWPSTAILHCHLHLRSDLLRRLRKTHKTKRFSGAGIRIINEEIMTREGCLASMTTMPSFERKVLEILQVVGNHDPDDEFELQKYLENQIFSKMRENLVIVNKFPSMELLGLTNNFTESLNTELKRRVNWEPVSLTVFAGLMLVHEYAFRPAETLRAFLGKGDYKLHSYFETEFSTQKCDLWYSRNEQKVTDEPKREAFLKRFQKTHLPLNYGILEAGRGALSTSSNGTLVTVVPSNRAAKKPCKQQATSTAVAAKDRANGQNLTVVVGKGPGKGQNLTDEVAKGCGKGPNLTAKVAKGCGKGQNLTDKVAKGRGRGQKLKATSKVKVARGRAKRRKLN